MSDLEHFRCLYETEQTFCSSILLNVLKVLLKHRQSHFETNSHNPGNFYENYERDLANVVETIEPRKL